MVGPPSASSENANILPLPEDFEPTPEEASLLRFYQKVKKYEKQAARIKEQEAKAKLMAADEKYQREQQQKNKAASDSSAKKKKKKKPKRRVKNELDGSGEPVDLDDDDDEVEDEEEDVTDENVSDDDEEGLTLEERREKKLAQMREDLEERKRTAEAEAAEAEERLRKEHLAESSTDIKDVTELGPSLKRKRQLDILEHDKPESSLIANLTGQSTPPHEFSKKLGMSKANLDGRILYPPEGEENVGYWSPPQSASEPNDGAFAVELEDFDVNLAQQGTGNNTLAIKFAAPSDSKRFSLNIAAPGHGDYHSILFHFNPRQQRGGQLVVNDKQEGIWGQGISVPLSQLPLMFGKEPAVTLIIQIHGDGFDVFIDNVHGARLEHRSQLPSDQCSLSLQFPSTDDYGSPENWSVYRVWWGRKPLMASTGADLSNVAGVNVYSSVHPRKLFVSGLTRISTEPEVDLRRAELERAFRKYGGLQGVTVTVPTHSTFAFVEVESERQADLALQELQSQYRLNRARRSKHEVLMEERAAAAAQGKPKETGEWD